MSAAHDAHFCSFTVELNFCALCSVAGKAALEKEDLEPALKALKERLMTKNVAEEIAEKLCESVATSIVGRKQASFSLVSSTVKVNSFRCWSSEVEGACWSQPQLLWNSKLG